MKKHLGLMLVGGLVAVALYAPVLVEADGVAVQQASSARAWTLPPQPPAAPAAPAMEAPPAPPAAASATSPVPEAPPVPPAALQATAPASPAPAAAPLPPAPPQAASAPKPAPRAMKPPTPTAAPDPAAAPQAPEPPPVGPGRERAESDPVNVRFDVTVSYQAGTAAPVRRSASIVVSNGSGMALRRGILRSGNSIPVPTTTFTPLGAATREDGKEMPAPKPMTAYNYRSVGFNVDVEQAAVLPGNRVRAVINIESSGVDDKAPNATGAPSFPTFSQALPLYLESGKPVMVAQSTELVDNVERKQTVEVKATILR